MADRGRPTLFRSEFTDMMIDYFSVEPYVEKTKKVVSYGNVIEVPFDHANDFPTLAGFAIKIGVHRDTLKEWSEVAEENGDLKYPDFSDAYKRAKDYQERFLTVNGLKGLVSTNFGIFTAKNVLGWRDKQPGEEDKFVVNNISSVTDKQLDERINALSQKLK